MSDDDPIYDTMKRAQFRREAASPTDALIAELRRLAEAATPAEAGGWTCPSKTDDGIADAAYIAAANPQVVLALLDDLQAAREALHRYGRHDPECLAGGKLISEVKCVCGLDAARAARPQAAAEERHPPIA